MKSERDKLAAELQAVSVAIAHLSVKVRGKTRDLSDEIEMEKLEDKQRELTKALENIDRRVA